MDIHAAAGPPIKRAVDSTIAGANVTTRSAVTVTGMERERKTRQRSKNPESRSTLVSPSRKKVISAQAKNTTVQRNARRNEIGGDADERGSCRSTRPPGKPAFLGTLYPHSPVTVVSSTHYILGPDEA